ncbi:Protein ALP1-like, partial [Frankliniella fusca]
SSSLSPSSASCSSSPKGSSTLLDRRLVVAVGHHREAAGDIVRHRTPCEDMCLMGLWMVYNMDTFGSVGLNCGVSPSVVGLLLSKDTGRLFYFERNYGIPGIVGAIDCTLKQRYIDKNHNYSINVQIVSNHRRQIIDTYVGQPGSVNDARVFRRSPLAKLIYSGDDLIGPDEHLVGDSAYQLTPKVQLRELTLFLESLQMMVPFKNYGNLTPSHTYYNFILSQCRSTIELTNQLFKGRVLRLTKLYCKSEVTTSVLKK